MSRLHHEPYAQLPERLLDADVSDRAIRLWCILDRHANSDGRAWPGRPKLAQRLRCGVSSLDRALAELVDSGLVLVEPQYRGDGSRTSNSYWLWPATPPVGVPLPTGEGAPLPPVGVPLPTQRAAVGNESQGNQPQLESTPRAPADPMAGFEDFWQVYPRRVAKGQARTAWPAAVKAAGGVAVVVQGARRFALDPNRVDEFTPHPTTWLRAERWDDPPLPPRTNGRPPPGPSRLSPANNRALTDATPHDPEATF